MGKPSPNRAASFKGAIDSITEMIALEEKRIQLLRDLKKGLEQKRDKEKADALANATDQA